MNNNFLSYAYLANFAQYAFTFFNGKINNMFPAKILLLDNESDSYLYGHTNGSIVIIYLNNIMQYFVRNPLECTEKKVKGMIMYVIIHELLHLDQDYNVYYNLGTLDTNEINKIIEKSNDAMTALTLDSIINNPFLVDEFKFDFEPMRLCKNSIDEDKVYLNSYYKIRHPMDKALFCLKQFLSEDPTRNIIELVTENFYETVFIELIDFEKDQKLFEYPLFMNGTFVNYAYIMNIIDNVILGVINKFYNRFHRKVLVNDESKSKKIIIGIECNKTVPVSIINKNQIIPGIHVL